MCGIVGYIGKRQAYPILIKGLKRLEYRGYDSAGIALITEQSGLQVYKTKGKVADLEKHAEGKDISGTIGIAHTRWATHGEPTSTNAHPHVSSTGRLAIIHNGIIENYAVLKDQLKEKGIEFHSDTDTEVLVQLIDYIRTKKELDLLTSVRIAFIRSLVHMPWPSSTRRTPTKSSLHDRAVLLWSASVTESSF
jgi:glucosamine--fructose-6-phosphate aminotransferase (isomerizing)